MAGRPALPADVAWATLQACDILKRAHSERPPSAAYAAVLASVAAESAPAPVRYGVLFRMCVWYFFLGGGEGVVPHVCGERRLVARLFILRI